jgi:hypothetical protein
MPGIDNPGGGPGVYGNPTSTPHDTKQQQSNGNSPTNNPSNCGRERSDGSKYFTKPHEAFEYMISVQKSGKEAFGVIFEKGVLVLPTHKNDETTSSPSLYNYDVVNNNLVDPLGEFSGAINATIHTHPDKSDYASAAVDINSLVYRNRGIEHIIIALGSKEINSYFSISFTGKEYSFDNLTNVFNANAENFFTERIAGKIMRYIIKHKQFGATR